MSKLTKSFLSSQIKGGGAGICFLLLSIYPLFVYIHCLYCFNKQQIVNVKTSYEVKILTSLNYTL